MKTNIRPKQRCRLIEIKNIAPCSSLMSPFVEKKSKWEWGAVSATYCTPWFYRLQAFPPQTVCSWTVSGCPEIVRKQFYWSTNCFFFSSFQYFINISVISKLLYIRTDDEDPFYLCIADPWELLLHKPETFPFLVYGLHQFKLYLKWR
jgi:hypothetical protein